MNLTNEIKRMLNALAYAHAGENLTRRQKTRSIASTQVKAAPAAPVAKVAIRPQVGLYLGAEVSADVMQYAVQTCSRLRHGLTVLTFQPEEEAQALLAPYQAMLNDAGIELNVVALTGEPPAALAQALRRRTEVAFLICNESGYFGHGVLNNAQRNGGMPVPVVLIAASDAPALQSTEQGQAKTVRAA